MTRKRYNDIQIYKILDENNRGVTIDVLVRKYKVSQATIYNWKAKYGKSDENAMGKLLKLEEENNKLRASFIELWLENASLKRKLTDNFAINV